MDRQSDLSKRIRTLSFIFTVVIVSYHCSFKQGNAYNGVDDSVNSVITLFSNTAAGWAMSFFFFTTGMLLFSNYTNGVFLSKIRRRIYSLLIPFIVWQIIYGYHLLITNRSEFLKQVFLAKNFPPNGPLWYLYAVFFLALISPLFYLLFKGPKAGCIVLWIAVLFVFFFLRSKNVYVKFFLDYGYMVNIVLYLPSYMLGVFYGIHYQRLGEVRILYQCSATLLIAFVGDCFVEGVFSFFILAVMPMLLLCLWPVLDSSKVIRNLSNVSFLAYASHSFIDKKYSPMLYERIMIIQSCISIGNVLTRIGSIILTLLFCIVIWMVLSFLSPRTLSVLTGGRSKPFLK